MKIGIIGASGKQGSTLCREAKKRGHFVKAFARNAEKAPQCVDKIVEKDLFSITANDTCDLDVLISAVGFGFNSDAKINRDGMDHVIKIGTGQNVRIMFVGGAGSLFIDKSHTKRVYEQDGYPSFLYRISKYMTLGYLDIEKSELKDWTYVCPSLEFDNEGEKKGEYKIGTNEVLYNSLGVSRISYADYALAMIDEAENGDYKNTMITVCEK